MDNKFLNFEERLGLNDFKYPPCWISATLKRNKKFGINLHGEANAMIYEERKIIMSEWHKYFHAKISELDTPPECVYNADQTGRYYQNIPNCVYVDEANE